MRHLYTLQLEKKIVNFKEKGLNNAQIGRRLGYTREYIRQVVERLKREGKLPT